LDRILKKINSYSLPLAAAEKSREELFAEAFDGEDEETGDEGDEPLLPREGLNLKGGLKEGV